MKFSVIAATAACVAVSLAQAADVSAVNSVLEMPTPDQALKAVEEAKLPAGIQLTGGMQPMQMTTNKEGEHTVVAVDNDKQEQWLGGGLGGWGGLGWGGMYGGGWGGWGGFGPYRFGYSCGGLGGWAYPLGFWNTFGAGIWGGGCGLGIPYGGLFYC